MKCDMNLLICMQREEESSNHVKQMWQLWNLAHTHFWQLVAIVFHSPLLPLSWYQVCHSLLYFLGGVFFWGVLLHDVYIVMERWEGGIAILVKWPWYMFVNKSKSNTVLYQCARHITVVVVVYWFVHGFLGGLSYLGVIKIKILSLFIIIFWHLENPY